MSRQSAARAVMWWRAINRSLLVGGVILLLGCVLVPLAVWILSLMEGDLNPDLSTQLSDGDQTERYLRILVRLPLVHLVVAGFIFLLHVPFLLLRELFERLEPVKRAN